MKCSTPLKTCLDLFGEIKERLRSDKGLRETLQSPTLIFYVTILPYSNTFISPPEYIDMSGRNYELKNKKPESDQIDNFKGEKSLEVLEQEMFSVLNEIGFGERDIAFNKKMMKLCQAWVAKARTIRER
mgnify:FL=1